MDYLLWQCEECVLVRRKIDDIPGGGHVARHLLRRLDPPQLYQPVPDLLEGLSQQLCGLTVTLGADDGGLLDLFCSFYQELGLLCFLLGDLQYQLLIFSRDSSL